MEGNTSAGNETLALVGPGRAGTTITLALLELGWRAVSVAGRAPDAPSTAAAAACLGADASLVSDAGRGASLVIVATPDRADRGRGARGRAVARARRARAAPRRIEGPRRVRVAARSASRRARRRDASACSRSRRRRSASSACAARGPRSPAIRKRRSSRRALGMRPFELPDAERSRYHAAAVVASNHLVALLGQVERLATGVRRAVRSVRAAGALVGRQRVRRRSGARAHRSGRRGDLATVEQHLATLDPGERDAYRTLAREVARLTGRRDHALDRLLDDVRAASATRSTSTIPELPEGTFSDAWRRRAGRRRRLATGDRGSP